MSGAPRRKEGVNLSVTFAQCTTGYLYPGDGDKTSELHEIFDSLDSKTWKLLLSLPVIFRIVMKGRLDKLS